MIRKKSHMPILYIYRIIGPKEDCSKKLFQLYTSFIQRIITLNLNLPIETNKKNVPCTENHYRFLRNG